MPFFAPNVARLKEKRDWNGLIKALEYKKVEIRKEAAEALKELGTLECIPGLLIALKDENAGVRVYAVQGLAKLKDPQVEEALVSASRDSSWEVQKEALTAMVKSAKTVEPILEAIRFNSAELREIAAVRLGEVGGPAAAEALISALKDEEDLVRLRAASALGKLRDIRALDALTEAAQDPDPKVANAVKQALAQLQPKSNQ